MTRDFRLFSPLGHAERSPAGRAESVQSLAPEGP